jgi:NADH:ubiquinone oxidoreductase subunit H
VSPVWYRLGFYIPEDDILHGHRLENTKSYSILVVLVGYCSICLYSTALCILYLSEWPMCLNIDNSKIVFFP